MALDTAPAETVAPAGHGPPELIEFVDFKWLMAAEGHRVNLERLQSDHAYARGCLALAAGSRSECLRYAAERLRRASAMV